MIAVADRVGEPQHWHAVFTRSRHEKVADQLLANQGFETYLPLVRILSQWKDRKQWVRKPLFPGYLFVRLRESEMRDVQYTKGVVQIVRGRAFQPAVVRDTEIENLKTLLSTRAPIDPHPYLKPGQLVRIRRGALQGVEGTIVRKSNTCLLVVSVEILGQSVCTEVPADCVKVL